MKTAQNRYVNYLLYLSFILYFVCFEGVNLIAAPVQNNNYSINYNLQANYGFSKEKHYNFEFNSKLNDYFKVLGKLESNNNNLAINKSENAIGIYQIRKLFFLDGNSKINLNFVHKDVTNNNIARLICESYYKKYEFLAYKNADFEVLARLHNGGCNWRKNKKFTDNYYSKFKIIQNNLSNTK